MRIKEINVFIPRQIDCTNTLDKVLYIQQNKKYHSHKLSIEKRYFRMVSHHRHHHSWILKSYCYDLHHYCYHWALPFSIRKYYWSVFHCALLLYYWAKLWRHPLPQITGASPSYPSKNQLPMKQDNLCLSLLPKRQSVLG